MYLAYCIYSGACHVQTCARGVRLFWSMFVLSRVLTVERLPDWLIDPQEYTLHTQESNLGSIRHDQASHANVARP